MSPGGEQNGSSEDDRVLVAEYALGLSEGGERAAMAHRLATEPALRTEMRLWRERLATLDDAFAESPAPADALGKIERRLFGEPVPTRGWWYSLLLWRGLTLAAVAVAVLAIGANLLEQRPQEPATQLVATLEAQENSGVEFVAFYDQASGEVRITSSSGTAVPDRDFELWYIRPDAAPVSMGVLPLNERRQIPLDAAGRAGIAPGTTLAVTLEQKGGSPTGAPQGPIVAAGPITAI
jgi:anti-sigma-K factor RskA